MPTNKPNKHSSNQTFENNPFKIIISGLKNAFLTTQNLAIFLIIAPFGLAIISFLPSISQELLSSAADNTGGKTVNVAVVAIGILLTFLSYLVYYFLQIVVTIMSFAGGSYSARPHMLSIGEAFSLALSKIWKFVLYWLYMFLYTLGYLALITLCVILNVIIGRNSVSQLSVSIPISLALVILLVFMVIRVYCRYAFTPFAIFDGYGSVRASLKQSKELTSNRLGEIFGVASISSLIPFLSVLWPYNVAVLYEQLKSHKGSKDKLPKVHILNYLVLFIVLGFALFISLVVGLVFILFK